MSGRYNNGNNNGNDGGNKFCAVCSSAGRPDYNTHFVRADKFDRNSAITCPYLLAIQCRICGGNGHTAGYCKFQSQSQQQSRPQPQRLPPISEHPSQRPSQQQQHRAPPRIVFETDKKEFEFERAFPPLVVGSSSSSSRRVTLPPLPLSYVSKVRNDEPLLRRGSSEAAQASPVHSPAPKRKRSNNPFAALESSSSDSDSDYYSPVAAAAASPPESSPEGVGRCRQKSGASWASSQPVAPRVAPLAPLAPLFKSTAKPNWGDTDSEDDEEFLKGF